MYVESLTSINAQQAVKAARPAQPSSAPKAVRTAEPARPVANTTANTKTGAADMVRAADPGRKTEFTDTDLGRQVEISDESDEAVTLSIPADDQLVDSQKNVNMERLRKIMEQLAATLPNSEAKFGIHEKTNRITIKLVDKSTHEVIKEIPPEKSLDLLAKQMEIAGVLLDQRR